MMYLAPIPLFFLEWCQIRAYVSAPKLVAKVCGGDAELQALFTIAVATQANEREGVMSLTLLRASLPDSITKLVRPVAAI